MLHEAVEAGGDTDTIASMAGQIAGAWVGLGRIPPELVGRLPESEDALRVASDFAELAGSPLLG